jgi:hypothetical protein
MLVRLVPREAFALFAAILLAGCAAPQAPPLSSNNPASAGAREGRTDPSPRLLENDELIQKANERLSGKAPVQPQYQTPEGE